MWNTGTVAYQSRPHTRTILRRFDACELKRTQVINQSELLGRQTILFLWWYINYGWRCLLENLLGTEESQLDGCSDDPGNGYIRYLPHDASDRSLKLGRGFKSHPSLPSNGMQPRCTSGVVFSE